MIFPFSVLAPTVAKCSGDHTHTEPLHVDRADPIKLRAIFDKYASIERDGAKYMSRDDFVRKFLSMYGEPNYNRTTVAFIAGAVDTTKDGFISFDEFLAFEEALCAPDALYLTAFDMFDTKGTKTVNFAEFKEIIAHTGPVMEMSFDFDCNFIKRYFGRDKKRTISYHDFCQLLHDFHDEQSNQAFKLYDKENTGVVTLEDFVTIMKTVKPHLLSDFVKANFETASRASDRAEGRQVITFPYFAAFNSLLSKIEVFKRIYLSAARGVFTHELSLNEFLLASQSYAQVTPYEVEILFRLAEMAHPGVKTISLRDFERIDPERLKRVSYIKRLTDIKVVESPEQRGIWSNVLEQAYRFALGSVAGACGATAVYPIDLVKTRMQNQRSSSFIGELMYKSSFDCFRKVVRHEGFSGLYRGLLPQIIGVAPEKAIKLTMNDFVRDKLRVEGHVPFWGEILAGATAGASQVMFTNPLEITKIRLQTAGEITSGPKVGVVSIVRELGFFGLYKGARACLLRDVPFSAIYFPTYAHMKQATADENGHCGTYSLFVSAFTAGVPAAALVTPADVIKTRLQVTAREGQTTYSGTIDAARKIFAEEGMAALWKGAGARVCRSSPQFAVTLVVYEMLQRTIYVDFAGSHPIGSQVSAHSARTDVQSSNPDHIGGYRLACATFTGIESKFGMRMPRFEMRNQPVYTQASSE